MSKASLGPFFGLLVWGACTPAQAHHPLRLSEVPQSAGKHDPRPRMQAMLRPATKADVGLWPNQELSMAKEELGSRQFSPSNQTVNVWQTFERGHKRHCRMESASLAAAVGQQNYQELGRQLLLSVKQSVVTLLLTQANASGAKSNRCDCAKTVELSLDHIEALGQHRPTELAWPTAGAQLLNTTRQLRFVTNRERLL